MPVLSFCIVTRERESKDRFDLEEMMYCLFSRKKEDRNRVCNMENRMNTAIFVLCSDLNGLDEAVTPIVLQEENHESDFGS